VSPEKGSATEYMTSSAETPQEMNNGFEGLGISPKLLAVLKAAHFTTPTPIQHQAIPVGLTGKDIIGIAQTGTGKTLAFSIPLIQRLASDKGKGLIILPTRELALQVDETLQKVGGKFGLRTAVLIGGSAMRTQLNAISRNPHVIVATPGRLIDHMQQGTIKLTGVSVLILDEADRMFDMGFAPQIKQVLQAVPKDRQTMLFSATMPEDIARLASTHMRLPVRVEIARAGSLSKQVEQELFIVRKDEKNRLLDRLLEDYKGSVLIFSRTKYGAKRICRAIRDMGHKAAEIHSERSLGQRRAALDGFKSGQYRVLVATDIASRGIDVDNIELVINYDIPEHAEDYVHRIGRTGRAGKLGRAISFVMPEQRGKVRDIERLVRTALSFSKLPILPPHRKVTRPFEPQREPSNFRRRSSRSHRGQRASARLHF
jgi:ATP-dependent RNA helicase RhlE